MTPDKIHLSDVMNLLEVKENVNGNPQWHCVTFVTYDGDRPENSGRLVRLARCRRVPLKCEARKEGEPLETYKRRQKYLDCVGLAGPEDLHPNFVHRHLILEFDNMKVVW